MSTWISHLRIAENMLNHLPHLDEVQFTYGNLAPDSGYPNADWSQFDPPKTRTHYLTEGSGESGARDLLFWREYLPGVDRGDSARYSFLLGYFLHLVTDRLASRRFGQSTKIYFDDLFRRKSASEAWEIIKTDWYGLDQRYVRDHPHSLFWRVFLPAPIPPCPLPYLPQAAFDHQMNYIKRFYAEPDADWDLDRAFPYMNESTITRFVEDTTSSLLKILDLIDHDIPEEKFVSAVEMLPPEEREPYPPPLGDPVEGPVSA